AAAAASFGASHYKQVLGLSYLFYEAQRSGALPASNRVGWRRSCNLRDRVVGGYLDAGDTIKHGLTTAETVTFLAWAALDFRQGHATAAQVGHAKRAVKWGADYLAACRTGRDQFVGLIGDPDVDHSYWGRPDEYTGERRAYLWNRTTPASDLLGMTSAALASASILLRPDNATHANLLLARAKQLYQWGADVPGIYSSSFPGYPDVYKSSRYLDKLMLAAAWLHRATGNTTYLAQAHKHYNDAGGRWQMAPYISWRIAGALLTHRLREPDTAGWHGGCCPCSSPPRMAHVHPPRRRSSCLPPLLPQWGNLRHATNVAFFALLYAQHLPEGTRNRAAAIALAKSQVDYALGSAGRSYVVGWGTNPPLRCHHRGASCPDRPAPCGWDAFNNPGPNPQARPPAPCLAWHHSPLPTLSCLIALALLQVLKGALVAGPKGPGDDSYQDVRPDYVGNEVAIDYNAGFTGALAGLLQ
ncbi:hypothetical protein CHLNCDRAFT_8109, partial [Chlorella variabilis]